MLVLNDGPDAQILSTTVIAASSSQRIAVNGEMVRFSVGTQGIWYKFGDSSVTATAGTAAEGYVPAGWVLDVPLPRNSLSAVNTNVAIIQAAGTAVGSVQMIG
jgi:hypothetical protein